MSISILNTETANISSLERCLKKIGVNSSYSKGKLKVFGKGDIKGENKIINVANLGDHRICMSSFVLALLTGAKTKIKNFETVFTSSPSFLKIMRILGARFEKKV